MGATLASRSLLWIVATIHSITATGGIYVEAKNYYSANLSLDCTTMCLSMTLAKLYIHARGELHPCLALRARPMATTVGLLLLEDPTHYISARCAL